LSGKSWDLKNEEAEDIESKKIAKSKRNKNIFEYKKIANKKLTIRFII
jgi:hypothetical protein